MAAPNLCACVCCCCEEMWRAGGKSHNHRSGNECAACECFSTLGNACCETNKDCAPSGPCCDETGGCLSCECMESCGEKCGDGCANCCEKSLDCVGNCCESCGKCQKQWWCSGCKGMGELRNGAECACGSCCSCCRCFLMSNPHTLAHWRYNDCRAGRYGCELCDFWEYIDPKKGVWKAACCTFCTPGSDDDVCEFCVCVEALLLPWCFMSLLSHNIEAAEERRRFGDAHSSAGGNPSCGIDPCMLCSSLIFTPLFGVGIFFPSVFLRYKMIKANQLSRRRCLGDELFAFFCFICSWTQISRELTLRKDNLGSLTVSRHWAGCDGVAPHPKPSRMGSRVAGAGEDGENDDVDDDANFVIGVSPHSRRGRAATTTSYSQPLVDHNAYSSTPAPTAAGVTTGVVVGEAHEGVDYSSSPPPHSSSSAVAGRGNRAPARGAAPNYGGLLTVDDMASI